MCEHESEKERMSVRMSVSEHELMKREEERV